MAGIRFYSTDHHGFFEELNEMQDTQLLHGGKGKGALGWTQQ